MSLEGPALVIGGLLLCHCRARHSKRDSRIKCGNDTRGIVLLWLDNPVQTVIAVPSLVIGGPLSCHWRAPPLSLEGSSFVIAGLDIAKGIPASSAGMTHGALSYFVLIILSRLSVPRPALVIAESSLLSLEGPSFVIAGLDPAI